MFRQGSARLSYQVRMRSKAHLRNFVTAAVFAVLAVSAGTAEARPAWRNSQMGESFDANRPGEIVRERQRLPLREVVRSIKSRQGGQFIDAEIVSGPRGGEAYVIKWVTDDGRRIDYLVDAETGSILDRRGD